MPTSSPYIINPSQRRGRPRTHAMTDFERSATLASTEPRINRPGWFTWTFGPREIYIDGEWHFNTNPQKFYLLGYAYDKSHWGWLYNQNDYTFGDKIMYKPARGEKGVDRLNRTWILKLLEGVETIYFYGPDTGQIERMFHIRLKDRYRCVNLLAANRALHPDWKSYKLADLEKYYGIHRETMEYKRDVDNLHRDWYNPKLRSKALLYNKEDVLNLIRVKEALYKEFCVTREMENQWVLEVTNKDKDKFKTRK